MWERLYSCQYGKAIKKPFQNFLPVRSWSFASERSISELTTGRMVSSFIHSLTKAEAQLHCKPGRMHVTSTVPRVCPFFLLSPAISRRYRVLPSSPRRQPSCPLLSLFSQTGVTPHGVALLQELETPGLQSRGCQGKVLILSKNASKSRVSLVDSRMPSLAVRLLYSGESGFLPPGRMETRTHTGAESPEGKCNSLLPEETGRDTWRPKALEPKLTS